MSQEIHCDTAERDRATTWFLHWKIKAMRYVLNSVGQYTGNWLIQFKKNRVLYFKGWREEKKQTEKQDVLYVRCHNRFCVYGCAEYKSKEKKPTDGMNIYSHSK